MIRVVAKNFIKKDKVEEVLKIVKELVSETVKEEGCVKYELYQDVNESSILTMIEEWENKDVLMKHMNSEHFKRIVPMIGELSEKPGDMNVYHKVI